MKIQTPYKSGWFTVVLPTLIFFVAWFGFLLTPLYLLHWRASDWVGIALFCGGIPLGFIAAILTYPLMSRLAARGRGELTLDGTVLSQRRGRRRREIDLAQAYYARIAADSLTTSLELEAHVGESINIYFHGFPREETLSLFPAPSFVEDLVITPEMGSWGFDASADDPMVKDFAVALLKTVWNQRQQNRYFSVYQKFPWDRCPQPEFRHIRLIEWDKRTPEDESLIQKLEQSVIDGLTDSYVRVTPDYLLGRVYKWVRSHPSGQPDYYCVMPLGYIRAEESVQSDYLYVRGMGADGAEMKLTFSWYALERWNLYSREEYYEAKCVVKFIQVMEQNRK